MKNPINHKEKKHSHNKLPCSKLQGIPSSKFVLRHDTPQQDYGVIRSQNKIPGTTGIPDELNKADKASGTPPSSIVSEFESVPQKIPAESSFAEAHDELQQKNEEIEALQEQLKRMQAEFENFRRRQEKAMEEFRAYAAEKLVSELLPIVDNLQRAIKSAEESCSFESLLEGIKLVLRQMQDVLGKAGLKEIDTNSAFDPNFHEAVMRVESAEHPDEAIVEEFQKGYILGDKVLRPALVKVARSINGGEAASEEKNN